VAICHLSTCLGAPSEQYELAACFGESLLHGVFLTGRSEGTWAIEVGSIGAKCDVRSTTAPLTYVVSFAFRTTCDECNRERVYPADADARTCGQDQGSAW